MKERQLGNNDTKIHNVVHNTMIIKVPS